MIYTYKLLMPHTYILGERGCLGVVSDDEDVIQNNQVMKYLTTFYVGHRRPLRINPEILAT